MGAWTSPRLFRWTGSLTLAAITSVILLLIGRRTGFASIYSLDDPYIHLAVAEEILRGHYGVNPDEAASASSSILYPILLTTLLIAGFGQFGPLMIAVAASFCTVLLFGKFIERTFGDHAPGALMIVMGVLSVLGLNLVGLSFTGMEHSLHVLLTLLALYGLVLFKEDGQVRPWWILTVVVAPFVRFEGMSTVLLVTLFLLCQRRIAPAITCVATVGAGMALWWLVMNRLELPFLPSSVLTKLDLPTPTTGGISVPFMALTRNIESNLSSRAGLMLFALAATLFLRATPESFIRSLQNTGPQYIGPSVALFGAGLIAAHLVAGKEGWFLRYEAYVLITGVVCLVSAFYPAITTGRGWWQGAIIASSVLVVLQPYTLATFAPRRQQRMCSHSIISCIAWLPTFSGCRWASTTSDG